MDLPDNYFRGLSPADIVAKVATITLANISLLGSDELRRIGWLDNPVIDILYSLTSAGVWVAQTNASGLLTEANSSSISSHAGYSRYHIQANRSPMLASPNDSPTSAIAAANQRRLAVVPITIAAGGAVTNTVIAPSLAGYKGRFIITGIISDTTDATVTIIFQDEDDALLTGCLAAGFALELTANVINKTLDGVCVYSGTAAKALEVDVSGVGAGAANLILYGEYFYEA